MAFGERSVGPVDPNEPIPIRQTDLAVLSYAEPTEVTLSRDWFVKSEQSARELKLTHPKRGAVVAHGCRPKRLVSAYFRGPVHLVALA